MNEKINGIIMCGRVFTNAEEHGKCSECDLYLDCRFRRNHYNIFDCDYLGDEGPYPFKFSQPLTDKLNKQ